MCKYRYKVCCIIVSLKYGKEYNQSCGEYMPKKLTVLIRDDLDEEFRNAVFKSKGMHKGNLSQAIEEAMEMWIREESKRKKDGK